MPCRPVWDPRASCRVLYRIAVQALAVFLPALGFCAVLAARPVIDEAGVVNAASLLPPGLPGGNLAPGALFLVRGRQLGPASQVVSKEPVEQLAGVSVTIRVARNSWNALLLSVSASEIRALVPVEIALGPAAFAVSVEGQRSAAIHTRIVASNPGLFTVSRDGAGPVRLAPARRGETAALLATGAGLASKARVEVFLGGSEAKHVEITRDGECCGLDRISFQVPADALAGCHVPIQLRAGGSIPSNTATIAIDPPPSCSDIEYLRSSEGSSGRLGFAIPFRLSMLDDHDNVYTGDALVAGFRAGSPGREASRLLYPPEPGTCTLYTAGGSLPEIDRYVHSTLLKETTPLNGGLFSVTVLGGAAKTIAHEIMAGDYEYGKLGGVMPPSIGPSEAAGPFRAGHGAAARTPEAHTDNEELFLKAGPITIATQGAEDVPALKIKSEFPKPMVWTNRDQIKSVRRSEELEIRWEVDDPAQMVGIAGLSIDKPGHVSAAFLCRVEGGARLFRVPVPILQSLPPSRTRGEDSIGYLMAGTLPKDAAFLYTATGLDYMLAAPVIVSARPVTFR